MILKKDSMQECLKLKKMLLIDGSSLLHRILSVKTGVIDLATSDGKVHTGGLHGFMISLDKLLRQYSYRRGALIAWDLGSSRRRRTLYSKYKEGRIDFDPEGNYDHLPNDKVEKMRIYYWTRKELHQRILSRLGCVSVLVREVEADDIIAYVCHKISDTKLTICSTDKDFLQLINDNVDWRDDKNNKKFDKESLIDELGLVRDNYVNHFLLKKAMLGDTSDSIEGIGASVGEKGFGEVTCHKLAKKIIEGGMDSLSDDDKYERVVKNNKDILLRNLKLVSLYELGDEVDSIVETYIRSSIVQTKENRGDEGEDELKEIFDLYEMVEAKGKIYNISEANFNQDPITILEKEI
jgi:5'-3' exonuclease